MRRPGFRSCRQSFEELAGIALRGKALVLRVVRASG
jgi:hypothetical protein